MTLKKTLRPLWEPVYFYINIEFMPLYMLTTTERVCILVVAFILTSLLASATLAYLPQHLQLVGHRLYFYFTGHDLPPLAAFIKST